MDRNKLQFSAAQTVKITENLIDALVNIRDEHGAFLMTLADGRVVDTKGWGGWEWTHGIGLYGLWQYWQQTRDPRWLAIVEQWFNDRFSEGTPTKNVNTMAPMLTLAALYEEGGHTPWRRYIETWANWVMYEMPRTELGGLQHMTFNYAHHQQLWDDTLMMSVMPLAKAGLVLNRPEWVEEAKRQFLLHSQYLCDAPTGLWYHGWNFEGRHHYAKALWGRGNSWVTVAIPDFIEMLNLQEGDPVREFLLGQLSRQVAALAERQDSESGLWHTLLDDPTSYLESSASAGFAYGILKAVRKRYIDKRFLATGVAAAEGVMKQISPQGELQNVSFGTGMGKDLDYYRNIERTTMPYGQAMAMLALIEYQNLFI